MVLSQHIILHESFIITLDWQLIFAVLGYLQLFSKSMKLTNLTTYFLAKTMISTDSSPCSASTYSAFFLHILYHFQVCSEHSCQSHRC
jgi:hypothetical protein